MSYDLELNRRCAPVTAARRHRRSRWSRGSEKMGVCAALMKTCFACHLPGKIATFFLHSLPLKGKNRKTNGVSIMKMKLEVVIVPVSDVNRAKAFNQKVGFRLDIDYVA